MTPKQTPEQTRDLNADPAPTAASATPSETATPAETLPDQLRGYLDATGESMRALSLRAGLGAKAVSDLLSLPGLTPRRTTVEKLSAATGLDLGEAGGGAALTYAVLIARHADAGEGRAARRLRWLCREAGWVPETTPVCLREAVEFLERHSAAAAGIQPRSYQTYKAEALALVRGVARRRARGVADLGPRYRAIYAGIAASDLPAWRKGMAGAFLAFLDAEDLAPAEVTTEVLTAYHAHRLAVAAKAEAVCRRHVREVAGLVTAMAGHPELSGFGFRPVEHPFADGRDKWGVTEAAIAPILAEFDEHVAPWARGMRSRTGQSREGFIAALDAALDGQGPVPADRKARLRARRAERAARPGQGAPAAPAARDADLAAAGFLTPRQRWSERTLACRRGYVATLAKAVAASTDGELVPESLHELLDPDFLEAAADAVAASNRGDYPSGYVASMLKAMRKLARDFQGRGADDLDRLDELLAAQPAAGRSIAPRNRAKLHRFDERRIQGTVDLGDTIIASVNAEIDRRRRAAQRLTGELPARAEVLDAELARDVMAAIAHELLLRRAPRSANVTRARLDWIAWREGEARLVIPAGEVKMRGPGDADLPVPLGARASRLLRLYLDAVRPRALREGDEANPFLFPQQGSGALARPGAPFAGLLGRVCRLLERHVGVRVNPHLYRHLVGWIWLKAGPEHLPMVQRLLGHKHLQTTLDYYAELDDELVLTRWSDELEARRADRPRAPARARPRPAAA